MQFTLICPGSRILLIKTKMDFLWFCVILQYFTLSFCDFNFDELTNTNYGMEILQTPVVMNDDNGNELFTENSFKMTSMHGQQYHCSHPDVVSDVKVKEEEQVAMETGVLELLKPMADGPCLVYTKGWWTYEFCFGREIKQYHIEESKISGLVTSLGKFGSEFNWEDEGDIIEKKRRLLSRYHSQQYVNGTICDLTGRPRETEVRFLCEEGQGDSIQRIDEPQTCSYLISVHTMKICHHPYLKPPTPKTPTPLTCQPLLSEMEYKEYQEEEERIQKEKNKYLKEQNTKETVSTKPHQSEFRLRDGQLVPTATEEGESGLTEGDEGWMDVNEDGVTESLKDLDKAFSEALTKSMHEIFGDQVQHDGQVKMKMKVFEEEADLAEAIRNYKKQAGKELKKQIEEGNKDMQDEDDDEDLEDEEDDSPLLTGDGTGDGMSQEVGEEDEDRELLEEFDENLREIAPEAKDVAKIAKHSGKIRDVLTDDFDSIIKEAREELGEDSPAEVDSHELTRKLTHTLNTLLERLEKAERDLDEADANLKDALDKQEIEDEDNALDWPDENQPPTKNTQNSPSSRTSFSQSRSNLQSSRGKFTRPLKQPRSDEKKPSAKVLTDLYHQKASDRAKPRVEETDENNNDEGLDYSEKNGENRFSNEEMEEDSDEYSIVGQKSASREKIDRYDINKGAKGSSHQQKALEASRDHKTDTSLSGDGSLSQTGTSPNKGVTQKSEKSISGELKTSVMTKDKKVEVKIVHAAYYDEKDGTIHILPDDDSQLSNIMMAVLLTTVSIMSNIMMAVLGDNREQWKEEERQQQLEKGYNFKLGKDSSPQSKKNSKENQILR